MSVTAQAQVVNHRSIGTGGILYNVGTAIATAGSTTVDFGGGASLPPNVGIGDWIDLNGPPGAPEVRFILRVDSPTRVTLQTAPTSDHNGAYQIRRANASIALWQTNRGGDLIAGNRIEIGWAYNDGPFNEAVVIDNNTTNATHYMVLTVAPGHRHNGTPASGVRNNVTSGHAFDIRNDFFVLEWFVITGTGGPSDDHVHVEIASSVQVNNVISDGPGDDNISVVAPASATFRNCIGLNAAEHGIVAAGAGAEATVQNCTFYSADGTGVNNEFFEATLTATNVISVDSTVDDFSVGVGGDYNVSSDGTAPGLDPRTSSSALLFVNAGSGDLHLSATATAALDNADDLSASFWNDVDGQSRLGLPWDRGADERLAPTSVKLASFTASGFDSEVLLEWKTASELNNLGFHVHRAVSPEGPYERLTGMPIPGLGSSPAGASYRYTDAGLTNGRTYYYKLEDIETTGKSELHGPLSATPAAGASSGAAASAPPAHGSVAAGITYGNPEGGSFRVLQRSPRQMLLELRTEGFYAEPHEDGSVRFSIPGFFEETGAGKAALPLKRAWVKAEAGVGVRVASVRAEDVLRFSGLRPSVTGETEVVATDRGTVRAGRAPRRSSLRPGRGLSPAEAARLVELGFQGDDKKALVELAPLRWDGARGELLLSKRMLVRLVFAGREAEETSFGGSRGRRAVRNRSLKPHEVVARLAARRRGLYQVSFEEVFGPRGRRLDGSTIRLSRLGESVAFHLEPKSEVFGPGSTLYFFSKGESLNPYGKEAVYELESSDRGVWMEETWAAPSGPPAPLYWKRVEREENRLYLAALLESPDLWLWDALLAPTKKTYPFEVSALGASAAASRLEAWLQGASSFSVSGEHHVRVYVNGSPAGEVSWEGKKPHKLEADLGPGLLRAGENEIQVENLGGTRAQYSLVLLDRFRVSYPRLPVAERGELLGEWSQSGQAHVSGLGSGARVVDLTGDELRWLTGAEAVSDEVRFAVEAGRTYLVVSPEAVLKPEVIRPLASDLRSTENHLDYLLLAPRDLFGAAEPLLELRKSQGLRSVAVALEDVYSEFGFGETRPEAIREFLAYAYHHWRAPSPRYVLLLGDASYDFKGYLGNGAPNRLPPFMVKTSYFWTASDPAYASVNGEDGLPDLAIGRLPAATADEARVPVEKIVAYETAGASVAPPVLVADNPDRAGNFERDAEEIASSLLSSYPVKKIYLGKLGTSAARSAIVEAFDQGAFLMSYLGHGGIQLWADENLFNIQQAASLRPQAGQPILLTLNCLNGYFHFPYFNSLSEELLKAEAKGVIAAFSPSGLSLNAPAHVFHKALLRELFHGSHERLGDAVLAAQVAYSETGAFPELLAIYHLLGDPALRLR